jgi:DNA-binding XRE family transcriptional regulator
MPTAQSDPRNEGSENPGRDRTPIQTPGFFEEKLPGLRNTLGWTQAELGQFFGVSKITAHRWERKGVGETEARKAALRLMAESTEASPADEQEVGKRLLDVGVVGAVTAALYRSPGLHEGGLNEGAVDEPVGWRRVFGVRDRLGWTQTEFALFLGVTHSVPAVWENPESGDEMLGGAIRAALLALDLSSDPGRPDYQEPGVGWDTLKTQGLQAFYEETLELRIGPPRSSP